MDFILRLKRSSRRSEDLVERTESKEQMLFEERDKTALGRTAEDSGLWPLLSPQGCEKMDSFNLRDFVTSRIIARRQSNEGENVDYKRESLGY